MIASGAEKVVFADKRGLELRGVQVKSLDEMISEQDPRQLEQAKWGLSNNGPWTVLRALDHRKGLFGGALQGKCCDQPGRNNFWTNLISSGGEG